MTLFRSSLLISACAALLVACTQEQEKNVTEPESPKAETTYTDPLIWMEEVEGEEALNWVKSQNERSLNSLMANPLFAELEADAKEIVNSKERIPYGSIRDGEVYNFWQDESSIRGLWRKTSLESYTDSVPEWETIIDVDALAKAEGKNWVFKGSNCFSAKGNDRWACMITLSDGGKDAAVEREFDLKTKSFVEDGFELPEAKSNAPWIDYDTLLVATDWGGNGSTLTESGYPSIVKRWTRGTPLEDAVEIYRGDKTDVAIWPFTLEMEDGSRIAGVREFDTFFTTHYFLYPDGNEALKLPIPAKATPVGLQFGSLFFTLEQDWEALGTTYKAGSLLAMPFETFLDTKELTSLSLVFEPSERQAIGSVSMTKGQVLINLNDNVTGKTMSVTQGEEGWIMTDLDLPKNGSTRVTFADKDEETVFINYEGYLTPNSLMTYSTETGAIDVLKSLPAKFDASDLEVHQYEATSTDGTKIPYFIMHKKGLEMNGTTPTLLYGYGGFQISLTPEYSGLNGKLWMERGGAYVIANIRGGGEFGPNWHQAGLKTKRQIIYDDFIAVGEDLIAKGVTKPEHLGIMGGSNGGLLMGVMLTQRPDLWNAVVVQVPLLDMLRYHLLLAGASWVDEYGSPDVPEEREWLEKMSPYHNFNSDADYPEPLFVTSTKDDRVHPAHARKMAKLFEDAGKPFLYYENIDGGHSAAANLQEAAKRKALEFTYLTERLFPKE